jgi:anti-sigma factor RsiW
MNRITDEELMAFADGALDEPRFSDVAGAVEADPEIAARLEELVVGGRAAAAVYAGLADLPVPARLARHIEGLGATSTVVPFPARRLPRLLNYAMAAGVAALIAAPVGYLLGQGNSPVPLVAAGAPLGTLVATELGRLPSGDEARLPGGGVMRAIATFNDGEGQLCREFEVDGALATVAVACRTGAEWRVAIAIDTPIAPDGYAPASSIAALDAFLGAIEAGAPMGEAEEMAALAQL